MNLVRESEFSSTDIMNVFAVMVDDRPGPTPNVPWFNGLRKLAVTHEFIRAVFE